MSTVKKAVVEVKNAKRGTTLRIPGPTKSVNWNFLKKLKRMSPGMKVVSDNCNNCD